MYDNLNFEQEVASFDWIPRSEFKKILSEYFSVNVSTDSGTDIYVCEKKY